MDPIKITPANIFSDLKVYSDEGKAFLKALADLIFRIKGESRWIDERYHCWVTWSVKDRKPYVSHVCGDVGYNRSTQFDIRLNDKIEIKIIGEPLPILDIIATIAKYFPKVDDPMMEIQIVTLHDEEKILGESFPHRTQFPEMFRKALKEVWSFIWEQYKGSAPRGSEINWHLGKYQIDGKKVAYLEISDLQGDVKGEKFHLDSCWGMGLEIPDKVKYSFGIEGSITIPGSRSLGSSDYIVKRPKEEYGSRMLPEDIEKASNILTGWIQGTIDRYW
jgi:hypothetical protein